MSATDNPARLIWSLAASGIGTTISGSGNSGGWSNLNPNSESLLDLRFTDDLALFVNVGAIVTTPTLVVQLDGYDDQGNLFTKLAITGNIVAAGAANPVYIGKHGGTAGLFVVLPMWGRVSWTCTGGSATGVEISLFSR